MYAILTGQLLITALAIYGFGTMPEIGQFMKREGTAGPWIPTLSMVVSLIAYMTASDNPEARRESPRKWILLAFFTLAEAVCVGFISSFYTYPSVITAMLSTAVAAGTVSLYTAHQRNSKFDLTQWGYTLSSYV